jgi:hypothetical protein
MDRRTWRGRRCSGAFWAADGFVTMAAGEVGVAASPAALP